jgi:hypothetical protein
MTVRTPFTDDIAASFSHQGELLNFNSRGDVTYGFFHRYVLPPKDN